MLRFLYLIGGTTVSAHSPQFEDMTKTSKFEVRGDQLDIQKSWAYYFSVACHTKDPWRACSVNAPSQSVLSWDFAGVDALIGSYSALPYVELVLPTAGRAQCSSVTQEVKLDWIDGSTSAWQPSTGSLLPCNQCGRRVLQPVHCCKRREEHSVMFEPFGQTELRSCLYYRSGEQTRISRLSRLTVNVSATGSNRLNFDYALAVGCAERFDSMILFLLDWGLQVEYAQEWATGTSLLAWYSLGLFAVEISDLIQNPFHIDKFTHRAFSYLPLRVLVKTVATCRLIGIWVSNDCLSDAEYTLAGMTRGDLRVSRVWISAVVVVMTWVLLGTVYSESKDKRVGTAHRLVERVGLGIAGSVLCSVVTLGYFAIVLLLFLEFCGFLWNLGTSDGHRGNLLTSSIRVNTATPSTAVGAMTQRHTDSRYKTRVNLPFNVLNMYQQRTGGV